MIVSNFMLFLMMMLNHKRLHKSRPYTHSARNVSPQAMGDIPFHLSFKKEARSALALFVHTLFISLIKPAARHAQKFSLAGSHTDASYSSQVNQIVYIQLV